MIPETQGNNMALIIVKFPLTNKVVCKKLSESTVILQQLKQVI